MILPPGRATGHYAIELVCLGNICRSPMAHVVLESRLADAGLDDRVAVTSSGTGGWHVGAPMDRRAAAALSAAGYDATRHRARRHDPERADPADLTLAMDDDNLADLVSTSSITDRGRIAKFRDFDTVERGTDVPDPYYGGDSGFEEVLAMVQRTADQLVAQLEASRPWAAGAGEVASS